MVINKTLPTFPKGGVHPAACKEYTADLPVENLPHPKRVCLFLKQHVGAACRVSLPDRGEKEPEDALLLGRNPGRIYQKLVNRKKRVEAGDVIGVVDNGLGATLHASIGGFVQGISDALHPMMGKSQAIVITHDPEETPPRHTRDNWRSFSRQTLLERIKLAGIVGLGGAGFPTHAKLDLSPEARIDTLILNGAECEPYLTCDHRIMVEHPHEVLEGAEIILSILGTRECLIGIEANKPQAIESLRKAIDERDNPNGMRFTVQPLAVKYPQGSADQIIRSMTGRIRPSGKRTSSIGVMVQNVYTAKSIHDAVVFNKPFYERVITVSGKGIARQANILVPIGAHLSDIVDYLGGTTPDLAKIVVGGPMMGYAVSSLEVPITKTTSGVLFLSHDEVYEASYGPCIRCGFCLDACPMGLEPNQVGIWVEAGRGSETAPFGLMDDCFECGSCAYACPAGRPLVQFIRLAKIQIRKAERKKEKQK